jgi:hypothetical protein
MHMTFDINVHRFQLSAIYEEQDNNDHFDTITKSLSLKETSDQTDFYS